MNPRAMKLRRLAGDFAQRVRVVLTNEGDAALLVAKLDPDFVEGITQTVCDALGIEYTAPVERPVTDDGKPGGKARANSPWQKGKGLRYGRRSEIDKT